MTPIFAVAFLALPLNPSSAFVRGVGERYLQIVAAQDPQLSLKLGLPVEHLPELSLAREESDAAAASVLLRNLSQVREADLNHDETLSLDVLRKRLKILEESPRFHWLRFPVTPYASPIGPTTAFLQSFPLKEAKDRERYLRLLHSYPAFIASIQGTLEGGLGRGIVLPEEELAAVRLFVDSYVGPPGKSPYDPKAERFASPEEAAAFHSSLAPILENEVNPALKRLSAVLAGEYASRAPKGVGLSQYPGGNDFYQWLVRVHTTLDVTPQEVHERGLAEVARVETEMAKVRGQLGFQGSAAAFRDSLKSNPKLFPKTPEQIEAVFMAHVRRIEPRIDQFFSRRPLAPYGVKRLAAELEAGETFGHYQVPLSADATGYYFFNGSHLEDRSLLSAAALIYHELVPGHHFQLNLAAENHQLPLFRRELTDTAYTEGWGEYASMLAGEMGMYEDPYDRYGRLAMEMFLSTRLVVDTGMNALGWSRAKALEYMRDHVLETETQIGTESLRYSCDIPGQALAYKMGARRIYELREQARSTLGTRFDIKRFHDAVLSTGSLPMSTLERHVQWFVEAERKP
jgi:uncharacterized protein (DUF885 family)